MRTQPIVVAVNDSKASYQALTWAADEAAQRRLPLRLVHVVDPLVYAPYQRGLAPTFVLDSAEEQGRLLVSNAAETVADLTADLTLDPAPLTGPLIPTLVAESSRAAVMVIGAHEGLLPHPTLGAVAFHLTSHAHCPVVVVHAADVETLSRPRMVVGVDDSASSQDAVRFAFEHASAAGTELVAVHAITTPRELWVYDDYRRELTDEARCWVSEALAGQRDLHPDVAVSEQVVFSPAAPALLAACEDARLLVVGSHGRGRFRGMLLGSVSHSVARRAPCPVAVARPRVAD